MHCLAAEPRETLLRVGVWDHGTLVAYETLVLGALRAGYRCFNPNPKPSPDPKPNLSSSPSPNSNPSPNPSPSPGPDPRCIQLRSRLGTRIELCHLFVHVALGEEVNTGASLVIPTVALARALAIPLDRDLRTLILAPARRCS